MDHNGDNETNEFEFGIHLDELTEPEIPSGADPPENRPETEAGQAAPEAAQPMEPASGSPGDDAAHNMKADIDEIRNRISELAQSFESKLKYDEHKNRVIDELHQALQDYRDGILKKYLQRVFTDVIKIVDDVRKLTGYYREQPITQENSAKLIQYLEDVAHDLEDIFAWEGVVSFNTEGDVLDPARQRVISKIETDDPAKDKMIARRLRPGYDWDGKVIRPEIVAIYVYNRESSPENKEI